MKTRAAERKERDRKLARDGEDVPYPSWEDLKAEDREEDPAVFLTVRDAGGQVVRRIDGSTSSGLHRVNWDLRYPGYGPLRMSGDGYGPLVVPGTYTVQIDKRVDGVTTPLAAPVPFEVAPLHDPTLPVDREATLAFQQQTGALQRAVQGAGAVASDAAERIDYIKRAIEVVPSLDPALYEEARGMELRLMDMRERMSGDRTKPRRSEPAPPGLMSRVQQIVSGHWRTTADPTNTHRQLYDIARAEYEALEADLRALVETELPAFEARLEAAGAPWTPGRSIPTLDR